MQTDKFVTMLKTSNGTNHDLTYGQRRLIQIISQDLIGALTSTEGKRPIPPQDLKTTAKFVEVVAQ